MYWYYKYVKKPWIIGETSIPADNDSVTYEEQRSFAKKTLKQALDCNAIGYSWWQYKDVEWKNFHSNFMGVINRDNFVKTNSGKIVLGTPKPVIDEFRKFNPLGERDSCLCFPNYYNYSESKGYRVIGRITDVHDQPIEGGVVVAWSKDWKKLNHTITKSDGSFELKGDFQFYYWKASATYYSVMHEYTFPQERSAVIDGYSTVNAGTIKLQKLHFE
jgi:hypothetical protein